MDARPSIPSLAYRKNIATLHLSQALPLSHFPLGRVSIMDRPTTALKAPESPRLLPSSTGLFHPALRAPGPSGRGRIPLHSTPKRSPSLAIRGGRRPPQHIHAPTVGSLPRFPGTLTRKALFASLSKRVRFITQERQQPRSLVDCGLLSGCLVGSPVL